MADKAFAEKRRFRRKTVRIKVDYQAKDGPKNHEATTLGAGGLFIETEEPLRLGTRLTVRFQLPELEEVYEIPSRVAWTHTEEDADNSGRTAGMGVAFTDPASILKLALDFDKLP